MKECGSQIILSNTYHLLVQPGGEAIEKVPRVVGCSRRRRGGRVGGGVGKPVGAEAVDHAVDGAEHRLG